MAENSWLFEVGVDTTRADTQLQEFVARTTRVLNTIPQVKLTVNETGATNVINNFVRNTKAGMSNIGAAKLSVDTAQAMAQVNQLKQAMMQLNGTMKIQGQQMGSGMQAAAPGIRAVTGEIESQTKALDFMTKAWSYSLLKFAEYEIIAKSIEGTIHELSDSLHQASDIQLEQTLQKLYAPSVYTDANQAKSLESATVIARRYGADIRDVTQVMGMWSKQTQDITDKNQALAVSTYLAAEAEKMHRSSGIDTIEVYRLTNAMMNQLGGTAADIPHMYDMIAEAALHMNSVLNNVGGRSKQEAFKDLFEGSAESAATMRSMHFSDDKDRSAGTIATVAGMVNQLGENGRTAAKNLTSMFAALEGSGNHAKAFQGIMGDMAQYKSFDQVLSAMQKKLPEIMQAFKNGELGVKPQQYETLAAYGEALTKIKKIYLDIRANSNGKLDLVTDAQVNTLKGQTEAMKSSFQAFTLALGKELLPSALAFTKFLGNDLAPALQHNAGLMVTAGKAAAVLAASVVALQVFTKVREGVLGFNAALNTFSLTSQIARDKTYALIQAGAPMTEVMGAMQVGAIRTRAAFDEETAAMERQKAVMKQLEAELELLKWKTIGAAEAAQKLGVSIEEVNAIAGKPAGLNAFVGGLGAMAMGAMKTLGPLMAIYWAMSAINNARNADGRIDTYYTLGAHEKEQGIKGFTDSAGDIGQGKILPASRKEANDDLYLGMRDKSPIGHKVREAYARRQGAKTNDEITSSTQDLVDSLQAARQQRGMPGMQDLGRLTSEINNGLGKVNFGDGARPSPEYDKPEKAKKQHGVPDAEDLLRHNIGIDKRIDSAETTMDRDTATAANLEIEGQKKLASVHGWNAASIKDVNAQYAIMEQMQVKMIAVAERERTQMTKDIVIAQQQVNATKAGTAAHEKARFNLSEAQAAYMKATGAALKYKGALDELKDAQTKLDEQADTEMSLDKIGQKWNKSSSGLKTIGKVDSKLAIGVAVITDKDLRTVAEYDAAIKKIGSTASLTKGAFVNEEASASGMERLKNLAALLHDELVKSSKGMTTEQALHNSKVQALVTLIQTANTEYIRMGDSITADKERQIAFGKSVRDMQEGLAKNNVDSIGKILGIDKDDQRYVDTYLAGMKQIEDEQDKINEKLASPDFRNATPQIVNQLALAQQELDQKRQLLPMLAEEAKIRGSIEYKATQSVLQKSAQSTLNKGIDNLFDVDKKGQGGFGGMLADWSKQVLGDQMNKTIKSLTDDIFHVKSQTMEERLTSIYNDHVKREMDAANRAYDASLNNLHAAEALTGTVLSPATSTAGGAGVTGSTTGATGGSSSTLLSSVVGALSLSVPGGTSATPQNTQKTAQNTQQANVHLADIADKLSKSGALIGTSGTGGSKFLGTLSADLGVAGSFFKEFGKTKLGDTVNRIGSGISGINGAMAGAQQGGLAGGLQTGMSVWQTEAAINPALAASPVGIGIAAAAGLFATFAHHDDPARMPDKYDTNAYGQGVADLTGQQAGANGSTFDQQSNIAKATGGEGLISYVEEALAKGKPSGMSQKEYDRLISEFGTSKTGSGTLEHGKDIGQERIDGAGADGKFRSYKELNADAYSAFDKINGAKGQTLAPIISMNAYGAGPGYAPNASNMIGFNASEMKALRDNQYSTMPGNQYAQSPYATPGVGATAPGSSKQNPIFTAPSAGMQPLAITTNLVVSGQVLATIVNAVNADTQNRQGKLAA